MTRAMVLGIIGIPMVILLASCSDDGVTEPPGEEKVASVSVTPNPSTVAVGRTLQLTATPKARNGTPLIDRPVMWSSSDTAIVRVSSTGVVTGVALGTATIMGTSENVSGTTTVTVTATPTGGTMVTWVGGVSSTWSVAGNWNPARVPGAADTVRIVSGTSLPVVRSDAEVARLIISGGSLRIDGTGHLVVRP